MDSRMGPRSCIGFFDRIAVSLYYKGADGNEDSTVSAVYESEENEKIQMVSTQFKEFAESGLMKDELHYCQKGYNLVGEEAGRNAGIYTLSKRRKTE